MTFELYWSCPFWERCWLLRKTCLVVKAYPGIVLDIHPVSNNSPKLSQLMLSGWKAGILNVSLNQLCILGPIWCHSMISDIWSCIEWERYRFNRWRECHPLWIYRFMEVFRHRTFVKRYKTNSYQSNNEMNPRCISRLYLITLNIDQVKFFQIFGPVSRWYLLDYPVLRKPERYLLGEGNVISSPGHMFLFDVLYLYPSYYFTVKRFEVL